MKETNIMREEMIKVSRDKYNRLFRNNVALGVAYDFKNKKLILPIRPVRSGLFKGSSDLIVWESIIVDQEMVGKRIAIFKAVETKSVRGKATSEQLNFMRVVKQAGGIGIVFKPQKEIK